ncbi:hypothetical protein AB0K74_16725 [Streptomyces sp. NPDC056159]|uniref:hypothetical protein n=1 Tax=Streptomyces sp. NPDC056159 TaxID=3155537 RepID=UPI00343AC905
MPQSSRARRKPAASQQQGTIPAPGELLDWRDSSHFRWVAACTLCQKPTPLRSNAGESVHKTCAEAWISANPTEARLSRFVSDPQPKRRNDDDHA